MSFRFMFDENLIIAFARDASYQSIARFGRRRKSLPQLAIILIAMLVACGMAPDVALGADTVTHRFPVPHVTSEPTTAIANPLAGTNLPIIAVWQDSPGFTSDTNYRYLRVAVWPDGRVVFARNPNVWSHDLLIGRLSARALTKLKQDIRQSGVFDLKGHCYLVPDAPVDCVMLSFGDSQQMLYWDEVENDSYGININSKPQHLAFKKAWWEVNRLVLSALPHRARKLEARFQRPSSKWYLKKMTQSE